MDQSNIQPTGQSEEYPVKIEINYPEHSSRALALATILFVIPKMLILIPHFILLYLVQVFALLAWIFGQLAVLFTGKYPKDLFDFVAGSLRWNTRVSAYLMGLCDKYPPFSLK